VDQGSQEEKHSQYILASIVAKKERGTPKLLPRDPEAMPLVCKEREIMSKDPSSVLVNPFSQRCMVEAEMIAILDARRHDRDMTLIKPLTRVVKKGEIHEFVMTDEADAKPGARINRVAYLAFAVITQEGILSVGDHLFCGTETIGQIVGYDETHMPNHMNIVIYAAEAKTGAENNLYLGQSFFLLPLSFN